MCENDHRHSKKKKNCKPNSSAQNLKEKIILKTPKVMLIIKSLKHSVSNTLSFNLYNPGTN